MNEKTIQLIESVIGHKIKTISKDWKSVEPLYVFTFSEHGAGWYTENDKQVRWTLDIREYSINN